MASCVYMTHVAPRRHVDTRDPQMTCFHDDRGQRPVTSCPHVVVVGAPWSSVTKHWRGTAFSFFLFFLGLEGLLEGAMVMSKLVGG